MINREFVAFFTNEVDGVLEKYAMERAGHMIQLHDGFNEVRKQVVLRNCDTGERLSKYTIKNAPKILIDAPSNHHEKNDEYQDMYQKTIKHTRYHKHTLLDVQDEGAVFYISGRESAAWKLFVPYDMISCRNWIEHNDGPCSKLFIDGEEMNLNNLKRV